MPYRRSYRGSSMAYGTGPIRAAYGRPGRPWRPHPAPVAPYKKGRFRIKTRNAGKTGTKTRRRRRGGSGFSGMLTAGVSYCMFRKYGRRLDKSIFKRLVGRQMWQDQDIGNTTCTLGRQATTLVASTLSPGVLKTIKDVITGTTTAKTAQMYLDSARTIVYLRNQSNMQLKCRVYDILARRDPVGSGIDTPIEAWAKGITDLSGSDNTTYIGSHPTQSEEFRKFYKILKTTVLDMPPGYYHEHIIKAKINKIINTTVMDNFSLNGLGGYTIFTVIVFYGTLVNDTSNDNLISFGSGKIDYAYLRTLKYGYLEKNTGTATYTGTQFLTTGLTPEFMGDSGMADQSVVNT